MRIVIFGATGRTGRELIEQALADGHEVTAFVRNPAKLDINHERLRVVQGDVGNRTEVEEAVRGQEAVLLALGHTKDSSKDVLARGTSNVLAAMKKHRVRRLVNLTGAGVADPRDRPKLWNKVMSFLLKRMAGDLLADSEQQVAAIRASGLDWTVVRVPRLTQGARTGRIRAGYVGEGTGATISRADAADFMLQQLSRDTYLHKAPMISG